MRHRRSSGPPVHRNAEALVDRDHTMASATRRVGLLGPVVQSLALQRGCAAIRRAGGCVVPLPASIV